MKLFRPTFLILAVVFLSAFGAIAALQQVDEHAREITPAEFQDNVNYLASDALEGRGNGSPGMAKAAAFIKETFKASGLQPLADDYLQPFPVRTGTIFGADNRLTLRAGGDEWKPAFQQYFMPVSAGAPVDGAAVVFAGYGITAADKNYDDYAGLDVKGKVVLILALEPQRNDRNSVFDGTADTPYSQVGAKVLNARSHGAIGAIIVRGPLEYALPLPKDEPGYIVEEMGIPAISMNYVGVAAFTDKVGLDLEYVQRSIDAGLKPMSRELSGASVDLHVDAKAEMKTAWNVVGLLPGSDPALKDEYVVIGAHYDHLGFGWSGSMAPDLAGQIHNGADDNASGTSGLMENAEWFGLGPDRPKRSIIFIAFGGEEMGILGSTFFLNNCPVAKDRIVAMLNMDMIGRMTGKHLTIGGVGTAEGFKAMVENIDRQFSYDINYDLSGIASSDHAAFTLQKIPVLFFFSGIHMDYHRPSDDADKINSADGSAISRFVAQAAREIADAPLRPVFVEVKQASQPERQRGGDRPYFGSMPDFAWKGDGYRFQAVSPGSPADKAGLRAGDILIRFGGKEIKNIYDYTAALGAYQPEDTVSVTVLRDGKEVTADVVLKRRGQ